MDMPISLSQTLELETCYKEMGKQKRKTEIQFEKNELVRDRNSELQTRIIKLEDENEKLRASMRAMLDSSRYLTTKTEGEKPN